MMEATQVASPLWILYFDFQLNVTINQNVYANERKTSCNRKDGEHREYQILND